MKTKTRRILCISIDVVLLAALAALYGSLPQQIPTHWGIGGDVTVSPKSVIWRLACIAPLFTVLYEAMPAIDPRKRNFQKFMPQYNLFCVFMNLYIAAFVAATLVQGFYPGSFDMSRFACVVLGVTFLVLGNMLPKFKSNFTSGIKTPWALSDDENWRKTHRLGGKLIFFTGIIWIAGAFLIKSGQILFIFGISTIMASCLIPYVMSYIWWREKEKA